MEYVLGIIAATVIFLIWDLIKKSGYSTGAESLQSPSNKDLSQLHAVKGVDESGNLIRGSSYYKMDDISRGIIFISILNIGSHFLPLVNFFGVVRVYQADGGFISLFLSILSIGVVFSKISHIIKPTVILSAVVQLIILASMVSEIKEGIGKLIELEIGLYAVLVFSLINLVLGVLIGKKITMNS